MHDDDGIEQVAGDASGLAVVPCEADGTCRRPELAAALDSSAAALVWLAPDGRVPAVPASIDLIDDGTAWVTLHPMTDAVKRVDDDDLVIGTVDRSTLRLVRPPALLPRRVVIAALAADDETCRPLDEAVGAELDLRALPEA